MKKINRLILLFTTMAVGILLTACGGYKGKKERTINLTAMDTYMSITCYGREADEALELAEYEIKRLDELWSVSNKDSEIYRINNGTDNLLSEDTIKILEKCRYIYGTTDGAFDVTIRPLVELWGFESGRLYVPGDDEIKDKLALCGFDKIKMDYETITMESGMGLDFGGIAKGYTSDRLMAIFNEFDIEYAVVSLGGNVQCYGRKPDGNDFKIAIADPNGKKDYAGSINVSEKAVITSGGYERYFVDDVTGKKYCHIIDPHTGYPVESDMDSITIVSVDGTLADGLSTACYVMGLDKTIEYWHNHKSEFDFIALSGNTAYVTSGIAEDFASDYDIRIIK